MVTCPFFGDDLIKWSVRCSMRGPYSANAEYTNGTGKFSQDDRRKQLRVRLQATADNPNFNGSIQWINGIVQDIDLQDKPEEALASLKIGAIGSNLAKRPINTERFENLNACEILEEMFTTYGALKAQYFSCEIDDPQELTKIVVQGSNLLTEAKKIAQASFADLFVNREGLIVAESWKDENDPPEFFIPGSSIINARRGVSKYEGPSRVRVRGRYTTNEDNGEVTLFSQEYELSLGLALDTVEINTHSPVGSIKALRRATIEITDVGGTLTNPTAKLVEIRPDGNFMRIELRNEPDGIPAGEHTFNIEVKSQWHLEREVTSVTLQIKPTSNQVQAVQSYMQGGGPTMTQSDLPDVGAVVTVPTGNMGPDESEEDLRVGAVANDEDLIEEYGVRWDTVDNEYIVDSSDCLTIGNRILKEFKMAQNSWIVNCLYVPGIKLNQIAQFIVPHSGEAITGLVRGLSLNYEPSPKALMAVVIESFEDLYD